MPNNPTNEPDGETENYTPYAPYPNLDDSDPDLEDRAFCYACGCEIAYDEFEFGLCADCEATEY